MPVKTYERITTTRDASRRWWYQLSRWTSANSLRFKFAAAAAAAAATTTTATATTAAVVTVGVGERKGCDDTVTCRSVGMVGRETSQH